MATVRGSLSAGGGRHGYFGAAEGANFTRSPRLECAMTAPRVLFVKLSSLGDVIHHLPAVTDLSRHRPDVHVAWAVEEAYAELVRLHPGRGTR